jgi:hypothetical protein
MRQKKNKNPTAQHKQSSPNITAAAAAAAAFHLPAGFALPTSPSFVMFRLRSSARLLREVSRPPEAYYF